MAQPTMGDLSHTLGRLTGAVEGLAKSLDEHKVETRDNFHDAAEARGKIYSRLERTERKVDSVVKTITEYEPDLKRCRMWRHAGIVGGSVIATGTALLVFWDAVVRVFSSIKQGLGG